MTVTPLSPRFEKALAYAAHLHRNQKRKGTEIPYVSHLLAVAAIVLENGGNEDEAIAALLHDAAEDQGGRPKLNDIRAEFGGRVADIVESCSDALDENPANKPDWRPRKERYHQHLRASRDPSVHLVSAADKLHNARATLADTFSAKDSVWGRFSGGREGTLWNYAGLIAIYAAGPRDRRRDSILRQLKAVVEQLESR